MKQKTLIIAGAVVVIGLAAFILRWQFTKPPANYGPSTAVGEILAEETAQMVGGKGLVVVIARGSPQEGLSAGTEQVSSFEAALKRRGSPKIATTEWLPRAPGPRMKEAPLTAEQLLGLMESNPDAEAFAVFTALPPLSPPLAEKITARSLKVLAVCGYSADVRHWLEARALAVAAVPRFADLPAGTPAPKTAKDWFAQQFELLTPNNVGQVPY